MNDFTSMNLNFQYRQKKIVLLFFLLMCSAYSFGQEMELLKIKKQILDERSYDIVRDSLLYQQKWDTLAQTIFWQKVMNTSPDSSIINIAATRAILQTIPTKLYQNRERKDKKYFIDSLRMYYGLPEKTEIYITSGKNHFYRFEHAIPSVSRAVKIFKEYKISPWYAQAILLIESPNKLQKSEVGAYGSFQLMGSIARTYGLIVTKDKDERKDFRKSSIAAIGLLSKECIPRTKKILRSHHVTFNENDLWFRLLVLHVYHAGYRNVTGVLNVIKPKKGGMNLITTIWKTNYRSFGNASQNYSQVALASLLQLDKLVKKNYQFIEKY